MTLIPAALIASIETKAQSWNENLNMHNLRSYGRAKQAGQLHKKYNNAFSKSYREHFSAKTSHQSNKEA